MTGLVSATSQGSPSSTAGAPTGHRPMLKLVVLGIVLLGLGGILGFSLSHELAGATDATRGAAPGPLRVAQRAALTQAEEGYVEALWPIHTDVEVAAERIALGAIFYKTSDINRDELRGRLEQSLSTYRSADTRLQALQPPESLRTSHQTYLAAVGLFEQSAVEMLRMFDDGSDEHLQTGYPLYLDGTNKIRDIGGNFWPDEFPPN
jgi:hypothetical protein